MNIESAIQQKHFESPQQKSGINVIYTAMWLNGLMAQELKSFGMTWQQFNAMRIIRGQKGKPASIKLIAERMIDPSSNASRIVDKLVAKQWVERKQCPSDRRQVDILATEEGLKILAQASERVTIGIDKAFHNFSNADHEQLNQLLDNIRI